MAYSDDIAALNPDHHWKFDGDSLDAIGAANGTDTTVAHTGVALSEDATNSVLFDNVGDRISIPTTTTINNSNHPRKALGGWVMVTGIQTQPKRIAGEGNATTAYQFVMAYGNEHMFEVVEPTNFDIQIIGNNIASPNRKYHFFSRFSGSAYNNVADYFVDGVKVLSTALADREPNESGVNSRGVLEFGDPAAAVGLGEQTLAMNCPTNMNLQHWYAWGDSANAELTDAQIREELFEKGALPDVTITNQAGLDALDDTVRADAPLCIRVDVAGSISLTADNVTFDPLASIHVQYTGTGTLTWTNTNGADASIGSVPGGGTITFVNPATLNISGLIAGSEVRVFEAGTTTEVAGVESSGTSYSSSIDASSIDVSILSTGYQNKKLKGVDMTGGDVSLVAGQLIDRQYVNA